MIPIDPLTLLAFVPAALALNLTPGADMMFCLGQGLRGGPKAALAADAGIALGAMIHVLIAGLGLGALVATSPWLFDAIRWAGARRGSHPQQSGRARDASSPAVTRV